MTAFFTEATEPSAREYRSKVDMVNQYMRHSQLPRLLRQKVGAHTWFCTDRLSLYPCAYRACTRVSSADGSIAAQHTGDDDDDTTTPPRHPTPFTPTTTPHRPPS